MLAEERQAIILQKLQGKGYVAVAEMAAELDVSAVTIRRDLEHMAQEGQCVRTRGGAARASDSTTLELPYDIKRRRAIDEKRRIAAAAAEFVSEGQTIILDAGSTTYELALLLLHKRALTVVTNDLQIATKLASSPGIRLVCTGGVARQNVYTLQGSQVEALIKSLKVDQTFLGADAIHRDGTISNVNFDEVPIKQAMLHAAKQVIVVIDSSKFSKTGFVNVCNPSQIDILITDRNAPLGVIDLYRNEGVRVIMV
ncbi:MAG TPA: DeoR/GlpR family DNA-binding transcription regulator [Anaerolineae bacterium]|nr:DeoR/GlpR family DNA-binding transcription regulator [Anaerolineae bacterium]HOQ98475.1 DeoR/GlpR family DNA-binding transcription regulator [Anaerolineae bacterium]HPL29265.1 DeoR/GlpR family DNA-binding transcription regulator [Anaerolineae bacterium]